MHVHSAIQCGRFSKGKHPYKIFGQKFAGHFYKSHFVRYVPSHFPDKATEAQR